MPSDHYDNSTFANADFDVIDLGPYITDVTWCVASTRAILPP